MTRIHSTAIVEGGAELADDVIVEAYARIGPKVTIGAGTVIRHGAVVEGSTTLGEHNLVFPYACLGTAPQDLKYEGEDTRLIVGNHNTFRENVTVNLGTIQDQGETRIGDHNLLMASTHIGHDCIIGSHCILSFSTGLAGHIVLSDHVTLGGMTGVHQFVQIGRHAFVGGGSKVGLDLPPFTVCQGYPARLRGINTVGMQRHGYTDEDVAAMRKAYRTLFKTDRADDPIATVRALFEELPAAVAEFLDFINASYESERKLMRPKPRGADEAD